MRRAFAVIGCHWLSELKAADVSAWRRTQTDVGGRPQTVLKIAGLASVAVHQDPSVFGCDDMNPQPPSCGSLAVILAVNDTVAATPNVQVAHVALGKEKVPGSDPGVGSRPRRRDESSLGRTGDGAELQQEAEVVPGRPVLRDHAAGDPKDMDVLDRIRLPPPPKPGPASCFPARGNPRARDAEAPVLPRVFR